MENKKNIKFLLDSHMTQQSISKKTGIFLLLQNLDFGFRNFRYFIGIKDKTDLESIIVIHVQERTT